ncbi:HAMP domain-containing protein [Undibacterium arcticum]
MHWYCSPQFFGTQVARRITRRLRELERMVSIIAAGNYSTRVPVQAADEIGSLGNAVNKMAEALALSHARQSEHAHELEQSNALLKQEVHEHQISAEKKMKRLRITIALLRCRTAFCSANY